MAYRQCPNGHKYDDENISCPFCSNMNSMNFTIPRPASADGNGAGNSDIGATMGLRGGANYSNIGPTMGLQSGANNSDVGPTMRLQVSSLRDDSVGSTVGLYEPPKPGVADNVVIIDENNEGATKALYEKKDAQGRDIYLIRGWLVCIEGDKLGADFKIYSGNNTVGRASTNSIVIDFDDTVSKDANMYITYDDREAVFYAHIGGAARNNVYVNSHLLLSPVELKDYDVIELGRTKLMFRSLCNDIFTWEGQDSEK